MGQKDDKIIRLYSRLKSLRDNLPQHDILHERYVNEYHGILVELQKVATLDLSEFRIPDGELKRRVISGNYVTGEVKYSNERECAKHYFLAKIDAILGYFEIKFSSKEEEKRIGFNAK